METNIMRKVIFDNGGGTDDIIALMILLAKQNRNEISLEGISVVSTGVDESFSGAQNIYNICKSVIDTPPPIAYAYGLNSALISTVENLHFMFPEWLVGNAKTVLESSNIQEEKSDPIDNLKNNPLELYKNLFDKASDKITFIVTGPLTNIARFIQVLPQYKSRVEHIYFVGGAFFNIDGNLSAFRNDNETLNLDKAECNVAADPKAADIVFKSNIPMTCLGLNFTNHLPLTQEYFNSFKNDSRPIQNLFYQLLQRRENLFKNEITPKYFNLCYPAAVLVALNPSICNFKKSHILVNLNNSQTQIDEKVLDRTKIKIAFKLAKGWSRDVILQQVTNIISTLNPPMCKKGITPAFALKKSPISLISSNRCTLDSSPNFVLHKKQVNNRST